jgi:RNA polymerase sigma-70 factor (ECF subfamily)
MVGRRASFGHDAAEHLRDLHRVSHRLLANTADAEDLVQDAYVRALRASNRFERGTDLKAWLLTILRNLARNHHRDRRRAQRHEEGLAIDRLALGVPAQDPSPESALLSRTMAPTLRAALESMPKALRDAVWLRDVEEFTYAEMASRFRIPLGTVMSRISRGRRLLHDRLVALEGRQGETGTPAMRTHDEGL